MCTRTHQILQLFLALVAASAPNILQANNRIRIQYPQAPINPTSRDCDRLFVAYGRIIQKAEKRDVECTNSQDPRFGYAEDCDGMGHIKKMYVAWTQCSYAEVAECRAIAEQQRQVDLCDSRIVKTKIPLSNRSDMSSPGAGQSSFDGGQSSFDSGRLKRANELYEKGNRIREFIQDPKEFLYQNLMSRTQSGIYKEVFGQNGNQFHSETAQQIYRYINNVNNARPNPSNPIIDSIQQGSLDALARVYGNIFDKFNEVTREIDQFGQNENGGDYWHQINSDTGTQLNSIVRGAMKDQGGCASQEINQFGQNENGGDYWHQITSDAEAQLNSIVRDSMKDKGDCAARQ